MEVLIDSAKEGDSISLNHNADNFKVSVVVILSADFTGKWSLQFSPNGNDWINHEDLTDQTANAVNNLFFQVPYIRFNTAGMTAGSIKGYVFGSVL